MLKFLEHPSQQFFSHVMMSLTGLNQYQSAEKVFCLRTRHSYSACGKTQTSNPLIPSLHSTYRATALLTGTQLIYSPFTIHLQYIINLTCIPISSKSGMLFCEELAAPAWAELMLSESPRFFSMACKVDRLGPATGW